MSRMPNQKMKLLYLMKILLEETDENHKLTLAEIAAELGRYGISAERKSLYDDLESLRVYGIDIQVSRGRRVEYFVGERKFAPSELKLLVDAIQSSRFITPKKSSELIRKIESLGSSKQKAELHRQVNMDMRRKATNEDIYRNIDSICRAISAGKKIRCKYFEWNSYKQRILRKDGKVYFLSPLALHWDDENYYLVAYDSEAEIIKHFRVDKLLSVVIMDETKDDVPLVRDFDVSNYSRQIFGMYGGEATNVMIQCDNSLAGVVIDRFGVDVTILSNKEEHFVFSTKVMISPTFFSWIMGFGNKMKVLSPASVADSLVELSREILQCYGDGNTEEKEN